MKTPSEISKAGREELKKILLANFCDGDSWNEADAVTFAKNGALDIAEFFYSLSLKSVEEWAEKNAKEISDAYSFNIKYNYSDFISLTDLITFLKEQSEIIKE